MWQVTHYAWLFNKTQSNPRSPLCNSSPAELKTHELCGEAPPQMLKRHVTVAHSILLSECQRPQRCEVTVVILLLLLHSSVTHCHIAISKTIKRTYHRFLWITKSSFNFYLFYLFICHEFSILTNAIIRIFSVLVCYCIIFHL